MKQELGRRQQRAGSGGLLACVAAAGLLGGCATAALYPPPTPGQIAAAEAAVTVARQEGQLGDPDTARHLRFAEQQLARAQQLAAVQDNRGATFVLARAQADAELSQALSRRAKAQADAAEAERVLEEARSTESVAPSSAETATPRAVGACTGGAGPSRPVITFTGARAFAGAAALTDPGQVQGGVMVRSKAFFVSVAAVGMLGVACGHQFPPPQDLITARSTFARASAGPARQLSTSRLKLAKQALDSAEMAYGAATEQEVRDRAYVAIRQSEAAEAEAATTWPRNGGRRPCASWPAWAASGRPRRAPS